MEAIIATEAERIGKEVRSYVREHFELRERLDITPLDDLAKFVTAKVAEALQKTNNSR